MALQKSLKLKKNNTMKTHTHKSYSLTT